MQSSQFVECGDWRIHYAVHGDGPNLLLLHGASPGASGTSAFARNIDALSRYFRTYVIDFPGWGASSKNLVPAGTWANPFQHGADVIAAFVRALGIERAHLIGNSFGGAAALIFAMDHPGVAQKIALVSPGGGIDPAQVRPLPAIVKLLGYYGGEGPTREKFRSFMSHVCFDRALICEDELERRYAASVEPAVVENPPLRLPPGHVPDPAALLCNDPRLASVNVPVLFVWGRQDECQSVGCLPSFSRLPNWDAVLLDRCGHWPQREHPERFNALMQWFLVGA